MAAAINITSPRRLFLAFMGLAPAAVAAAAVPAVTAARSRDHDFLELAKVVDDSKGWQGDDWDDYRRLNALRAEAFEAMAKCPVHTVEGVAIKAKIVAEGYAQVMHGHPTLPALATGLIEDIDRVLLGGSAA